MSWSPQALGLSCPTGWVLSPEFVLVTPLRGVTHLFGALRRGAGRGSARSAAPRRDTAERCHENIAACLVA